MESMEERWDEDDLVLSVVLHSHRKTMANVTVMKITTGVIMLLVLSEMSSLLKDVNALTMTPLPLLSIMAFISLMMTSSLVHLYQLHRDTLELPSTYDNDIPIRQLYILQSLESMSTYITKSDLVISTAVTLMGYGLIMAVFAEHNLINTPSI